MIASLNSYLSLGALCCDNGCLPSAFSC